MEQMGFELDLIGWKDFPQSELQVPVLTYITPDKYCLHQHIPNINMETNFSTKKQSIISNFLSHTCLEEWFST